MLSKRLKYKLDGGLFNFIFFFHGFEGDLKFCCSYYVSFYGAFFGGLVLA